MWADEGFSIHSYFSRCILALSCDTYDEYMHNTTRISEFFVQYWYPKMENEHFCIYSCNISIPISWGRAWRSLISAEAIFYISGSQQGLGYWIYSNRAYANMCDVMVGVLMIVLISIAVEKMFQIIENRTIKKWGVTK